ncbi:MAG TPA: MauE/DoxX family redox-associated membrane protein [Acidimicrobiales bacterium]|nr:MauE/DoxX family redox-associated membrane protein [Acidimicrobiales bacterium]
MDGLGYAAALLLALVFVVAGVAKLVRPRRTATAFALLGLPIPRVLALVVPLAEILVAALLVAAPSVGGAAALVALAFFTTLIVGKLRRGDRVPCGCFGAARPAPLTAADVVRNVILGALAVGAILQARPEAPSTAAWIAAAVAGAQAWIIVGSLRALALRRLAETTPAAEAPPTEAPPPAATPSD